MYIFRLFGCCALLLCLVNVQAVHAQSRLTVGVVPQFPPEQIFAAWTPVLAELSRATGITLELKIYPTIPDFEKAFLKGELDIAYANPYHAVMAHRAAGYQPLIRDKSEYLSGILVVRKDSPLTSLADLDGATIAFPAPNAFGASLYIRALLSKSAGIRYTAIYRTTHSNVYRHVIAGRAAAGGGVRRTLEKEPPEVQAELRILYETPPVPPHPVIIHPRVTTKSRQAVQQAFLQLVKTPSNQALLSAILIPEPAPATYTEYAPLEKLGVERFVVLKED